MCVCVCVCAGEMSQQLKSSAEDTGLVLSTHAVLTIIQNSKFRGYDSLFLLLQVVVVYTVHIYGFRQNSQT